MANCAKCNAELNPGAKFCAGCGMPVTTPAPLPPVNPFAATASPTSKNAIPPVDSVVITNAETTKRDSGVPPLDDTPSDGIDSSPVSPLAVSGALSQRGAFQQAVASIKEIQSALPPPASTPPRAKKPGTQVMPSAPTRPGAAPPADAPDAGSQPQPPPNKAMRTMAMVGAPKLVVPGATGQPPSTSGPSSVAPQASAQPSAAAQPAQPQPAQPAYPANAPYGGQSGQQGAANAAAGWGWGGSYYPGSRVQVTWSNGQRYPATVSQVNGSHCLVVFPDGQQHWVEMTYLSPG